MLRDFIASHCAQAGTTPLKLILKAFRSQLPDTERKAWTRSRFLCELASLGYVIGDRDGVATVAGLSIPTAFRVENGRLISA